MFKIINPFNSSKIVRCNSIRRCDFRFTILCDYCEHNCGTKKLRNFYKQKTKDDFYKGEPLMNKDIESIKMFLKSCIKEMEEYIEDDNYDDLEQHDCSVAQEAYEHVLHYVENL